MLSDKMPFPNYAALPENRLRVERVLDILALNFAHHLDTTALLNILHTFQFVIQDVRLRR